MNPNKINIIFPYDQLKALDGKEIVEFNFSLDYQAAYKANLNTSFYYNDDLVIDNDPEKAIRNINKNETPCHALFRGFAISDEKYESLYKALLEKNVILINSPDSYSFVNKIQNWYHLIENDNVVQYYWLEEDSIDKAWALHQTHFKNKGSIVKDLEPSIDVWEKGGYIPKDSSYEEFCQIYDKYKKYIHKNLKGIRFRECEPSTQEEYRLFFFNGDMISSPFSRSEKKRITNLSLLKTIARTIDSDFIFIDILLEKNGKWVITDIGDAGFSGIHCDNNINRFYKKLSKLKRVIYTTPTEDNSTLNWYSKKSKKEYSRVTGSKINRRYWFEEKNYGLHNDEDIPSEVNFCKDEIELKYYKDNKLHREGDNPAILIKNKDKIICEEYFKNGSHYRDNGQPTIIDNNQ